MKTKKPTKKVAAKPPAKELNVNLDYVMAIADEAIATVMALQGLVRMLVAEKEDRDAR